MRITGFSGLFFQKFKTMQMLRAKIRNILNLSALLFCFTTCVRDFEPVYKVPPDIQPYLDTFIEEAQIRGFDYKIDNLFIVYDSLVEYPTCGICNETTRNNNVQKIIRINPQCEITYSEQLEALIFHELGHCFLGRFHTSEKLPSGAPKSMMVPGNTGIYSPCVYSLGGPCDLRFRRTYYLDELFDENTPVPDWEK